ncbi:hypothetical protein F4820DRAFT_141517 [Hypoxylon rubiginosum]|uniref:Uncharacterized protein n=1 Tax=Hypoxylon rubiginosum TaxID=110542 RepID=A0ACB9YK19_9PEZI|nr:hypothetical protein F4820DRAFT_141517 [Hypoxylon rubiginosum]
MHLPVPLLLVQLHLAIVELIVVVLAGPLAILGRIFAILRRPQGPVRYELGESEGCLSLCCYYYYYSTRISAAPYYHPPPPISISSPLPQLQYR